MEDSLSCSLNRGEQRSPVSSRRTHTHTRAHTHTRTHTPRTHTHEHTHGHTHGTCTHIHACTHTHTNTHTDTHTRACTHTHGHTYTHAHWWFPEAIHSLSVMAQEFLACFSQLSHEHCWYVAFPHPVQSLILPCSYQSLPCSWGLSPPNLVRQWWHQVNCVLEQFSFVLRTSCEVECGHSHALTTVYSVWIGLDFCVPQQFLFWVVQV